LLVITIAAYFAAPLPSARFGMYFYELFKKFFEGQNRFLAAIKSGLTVVPIPPP
jgi:hypothetical protein